MTEHGDALMREKAVALLVGVDLDTVRVIDTREARRLAGIAYEHPGDLSEADRHALALWAAKGGVMPT